MCLLCKNPIGAPSTAGCFPVEHLPDESKKAKKLCALTTLKYTRIALLALRFGI